MNRILKTILPAAAILVGHIAAGQSMQFLAVSSGARETGAGGATVASMEAVSFSTSQMSFSAGLRHHVGKSPKFYEDLLDNVGIFPKFILGHRNDLSAFKCPPYIICNSNNKIFPHPAYFINFV